MAGGCEGICCDECGAEITWTPIVIDGRPYCCHECGLGMECDCASGDPRWMDEVAPFWIGSVEDGAESSDGYGLDYYAFE